MGISIPGSEKANAEPNVVPLCDVLLVLLIIFMVVTPLVQRGVDVKLPTALNTINMPDNPDVVMAIRKDGTIYVNQTQVSMDNLQSVLDEAFLSVNEKKLYLRADQDLEYGKVVELIETLKFAGVEIMGFITDKKTEKVD